MLATVGATDPAWAQPAEQRFCDGLVARRLFDLAELQCRNRLADANLSSAEQVAWTVELIRILGQHASHCRAAEQTARWQAAHSIAQDFVARYPQHPRLVLVQIQDALTSLAAGELARMEAEVAILPDEALVRARDQVRTASRQLESLDKQLTEQLAGAAGSSRPADALVADELFSLQNNVRFQLARAYRNQALCYPHDSHDRLAALSLAIEQLNATLTQLQTGDALTWKVYLDLAVCYRLLGNLEQAQRSLTTPLSDVASPAVRLDARAEQARVMIAAGHPEQALDELGPAAPRPDLSSPELDYARLEAMLALFQAARSRKDDTLAEQWQKKATATVDLIEQNHGDYWGHRANLALLAVSATGIGSGNVEILARAADKLYLEGQLDEAITKYEQGATQARATNDLPIAFELDYKAALIQQKQQHYGAASQRLRNLAVERPTLPQSPQTHLLAAWNAAQEVRVDEHAANQYLALLQEHLELWPTGDTTNTARQWLGGLLESQGQWESAIDAYRGITSDALQFPAAIAALARCWQQWLQQLRRDNQPTQAICDAATQFFDQLILGSEQRWPERWSEAQRVAAVAAARLRLEFARDSLVDAQRVLQAALAASPEAPEAWREEAQTLQIVALAGQPDRQPEAQKLLRELGSGSTDRLLELIHSLSALAETASPAVQAQLAQLQLAALDQLKSTGGQLEARQRLRMEQVRAGASRASGKQEAALQLFRQLAAEQPANGAIQLQLAELMLESDDKETLSAAVRQWQVVAGRVRPGTDEWFRARYSIALALFKRNRPASGKEPSDRAVAAQRLQYLKATSKVDETEWKDKVDVLLQRCTAG